LPAKQWKTAAPLDLASAVIEHHQVPVEHVWRLGQLAHGLVIDQRQVPVGGRWASKRLQRGEWARRRCDLGLASEVDDVGHPIRDHRFLALGGQAAQVVGADEHAAASEPTRERKAAEIPGVAAVRPIQPARAHD